MSGSLVADLGIGAGGWLFLSLLACLTLFFKFSRILSVRNLDLFLLFALAPGMMQLVGNVTPHPWRAYVWLFVGSSLWLLRCALDLTLVRRPVLDPNLSASGLACVAVGLLGMMVVETVSLPMDEGAARNPADPSAKSGQGLDARNDERPDRLDSATVRGVIEYAPLPGSMKTEQPQVIVRRVLASLAHLGMVAALIYVGWVHFEKPLTGLAIGACYVLIPYTRIAIVDSGQLVPSALVVSAVAVYTRPICAGALIGLASGWVPACLGLIPLWTGFYRGRGAGRFAGMALVVLSLCAAMGRSVPILAEWAKALGARSLTEAGLVADGIDPLLGDSFWAGIDPSYRQPVLIAYLALVIAASFLPMEKNLGELISLTGALLVASQFWYLDEGGTLVMLYLPVVLLMMFRPNLANKRPPILGSGIRQARQAISTYR